MKKITFFLVVVLIIIGSIAVYFFSKKNTVFSSIITAPVVPTQNIAANNDLPKPVPVVEVKPAIFINPIGNAVSRITKKKFGTKVSPTNSPVPNERFTGFHTGVDFEMLDKSELTKDIEIRAVCTGPLRQKKWVSGYGGLVVQECTLNGKSVSVVYGHFNIASVTMAVGTLLEQGQHIGILGTAYSKQTDGERKHLHLGFYNGAPADIRGYVPTKAGLAKWIDPCTYICK